MPRLKISVTRLRYKYKHPDSGASQRCYAWKGVRKWVSVLLASELSFSEFNFLYCSDPCRTMHQTVIAPRVPSIVESSEKVIPVEKPKRFPKSWLKFEIPQLCLLIVLIWRQYGHFPASRQDRASVLNPAPGSHAKTYETDQTRKHQKPKTEVLVWFSLLWYNRDKVCVQFFKACSLVEQMKWP